MLYSFYLGLLLYISLQCFVIHNNATLKHNVDVYAQYVLLLFVLFSLFGLRGYVFTDWINYNYHFMQTPISFSEFVKDCQINGIYEVGFNVLQFICKKICNNYFFFQFINAYIDLILIVLIIKDFEIQNIPLFFVTLLAFKGLEIEFNLLRNSKAIYLFFFSLRYVYEDKSFIKYLIINLIGFLFHASALLFIPVYFILDKKLPKWFLILLFLILVLIMTLHISLIFNFMGAFLSFVPDGEAIKKLLMYMKGNQGILFSPIYLERILIYMLILISYQKLIDNKRTLVLINIYIVYFLFCFFCWDVEIIVKRGSLLFVPCIWLLFPYFLSFLKTKQSKCLFLILFLVYCSYKVYKDCSNNSVLYRYSFCFMESDPTGKAKLYNKILFGNK